MAIETENNSVNQAVKNKLVSREVESCLTSLIDDCLRNETIDMGDLENYYRTREQYIADGLSPEEADEQEGQGAEVLEWWTVSKWLHGKLRDKGEVVYCGGSFCLWGRQCSGQSILLDNVISEIASDMEILEGQANHSGWAS